MEPDGSNPRVISEGFDRSPTGLTWSPDASGLYFSANSEGHRNLYFVSIDGGVRQVTEGTHMVSTASISDQGLAVGTLSSLHEPGEVVTFDLTRPDQLRRVTRVNDDLLEGVRLGEVEELWYRSIDEWDIQGWLIKPPDFDPDRQYPLMLVIHGGPHAMYNVGFNFGWQEHAANRYLVLYTNPRGSSGCGSAFGNLINNAYPGDDYHDLMAGVDSVVARGYVDRDNKFVYGCSGGGVLTAWVVGHTDRFAAASSNCPVISWISFVGTTDGLGWYRNFEHFPWDDPTEHLRRSPLMYVGNVSTPTMLRLQDEWHGTSSTPSNFMRTQLYLRSWFERWGTGRAVEAQDGF